MSQLLDNLINKGELPTVQVQAEIDNKTIFKLAAAIMIVTVASILIHIALNKAFKVS